MELSAPNTLWRSKGRCNLRARTHASSFAEIMPPNNELSEYYVIINESPVDIQWVPIMTLLLRLPEYLGGKKLVRRLFCLVHFLSHR